MVQERKTDHLGGGLTTQSGYAFTGEPLRRRLVHHFSNGTSMTEDYSYAYDLWGRLLRTGHKIGSGTEVTLSANTYDSVGRLSRKDRAGNSSIATTYSYNVRSWLTGQTGPYTETLSYNTQDLIGGNTPQWGGNISAHQWVDAGTSDAHRYAFSYDGVSRLTVAAYSGSAGFDYATAYTYDRHGNLKTLLRKGSDFFNLSKTVTSKSFTYDGNQLQSDDPSLPSQYLYDAKGRVKTDMSSGIQNVTYNELDLPELINFVTPFPVIRNARYWYGADGVKLRSEMRTSTDTLRTDYAGNLIYVRDTLRTILVDGGYIDVTYPSGTLQNQQYSYRWYLTDYQGSTCAVIDSTGTILQMNLYYPYGYDIELPAPVYSGGQSGSQVQSGQDFKFSGKEQLTRTGLGWYDFGARWYDPLNARWTTPDPLAEKYYAISPYAYCAGNPVNLVDPDGSRIDEYYSSLNGKYLGSDCFGDTARLISQEEYSRIAEGSKKVVAVDKIRDLRNTSKVIQFDDIEAEAQRITDLSREYNLEYQLYILLDRKEARVYAVAGPVGKNDTAPIQYYEGKATGASFYEDPLDNPGGPIIIGQIHGHPKSLKPGMVTEKTMSPYDVEQAKSLQIPIYATDAMDGIIGSSANMHMVMPSGKIRNNIGKTPGARTHYTQQLSKEIFRIWGRSGKPTYKQQK